MTISKLFTPVVHAKETSVDDAREKPDMFVNVPVHAEVPRFQGPTDKGGCARPLSLRGSGKPDTSKVQQRGFKSRRFIDY